MSPPPTILETARQLHAEERGDLPDDPEERAAALSRLVVNERPDIKTRSAQRAAAEVVGVEPPASRAGRAAAAEKQDRARAKRIGRRARRAVTGPRRKGITGLGLRGGRPTIGGLLAQALGLVLLYWLLRTSAVVPKLTEGAARALRWLRDPVPLGGSPQ